MCWVPRFFADAQNDDVRREGKNVMLAPSLGDTFPFEPARWKRAEPFEPFEPSRPQGVSII